MGVELEDLQALRTEGALTPGHPEYGHTPGVELTTGPLGTGIASAVGFAMAERFTHGLLDPATPYGESVFDHKVYVIAGDGCLQEGVSAEASSLAGTQKLGNLIVLWDDNRISIEGDTDIAFSEDVLARYAAYGWHVQRVNWLSEDGSYTEDVTALDAALEAARANTEQPSIIALRTVIGWPTPEKMNTGGIHGAKLGTDALRGLKEALGANPDASFDVDEEAVAYARSQFAARAKQLREEWDQRFSQWQEQNPEKAALLARLRQGEMPSDWESSFPTFPEGQALATRSASGKVLNAIAPTLPELWGGSADLAGSNNTFLNGLTSFLPEGTFSDFMRGAVRLAALMDLPVTYVWTHDSIGVGEDGPTHQPIEHLAAYRAIPNLAVVRPADAAETAEAWKATLLQRHPVGLVLSRQNLPNPARGEGTELAGAEGLRRGAYVLADCEGTPDILLLASGSEVAPTLQARAILAEEGLRVRVISVPCLEWFEAQDEDYRESVLPCAVRARVAVEAGIAMPWYRWVGDCGRIVSLEHFGESTEGSRLFEKYGFTPENIAAKARESFAAAH